MAMKANFARISGFRKGVERMFFFKTAGEIPQPVDLVSVCVRWTGLATFPLHDAMAFSNSDM